MRLGKILIDAASLDAMFACVEVFGALLVAASKGDELSSEVVAAMIGTLEGVATGKVTQETGDPLLQAGLHDDVLAVLTEYEEHRLRENIRKGRGLFLLRTSFELASFDVGLAELDNAVKSLGEVITKLPSSEATDPGLISFDIIVGSDQSADDLATAIADDRVDVVAIQRRSARKQSKDSGGTAEPERGTGGCAAAVSVT